MMGNDKRREVTNRIIALLEQTDISQGYPNLYQRIKEWIDEIPTEAQNGDLVSRKDAIDALMSLPRWVIDSNGEYQPVDANISSMIDPEDAVSAIENLPSVQSERKKGKWIELTNTNHTYICSVCGRMLVNITDGKNTVTKNHPFCHCGADMRGELDDND